MNTETWGVLASPAQTRWRCGGALIRRVFPRP